MTRTIIEYHILQTVGPNSLNRDDLGNPKTATYGGAVRSRVSSQAWKHATRVDFEAALDPTDLGVRTAHIGELIANKIIELSPALRERADDLATATVKAIGKLDTSNKSGEPIKAKALVFLSNAQIGALAEAAITANATDDPVTALRAANVKALADTNHSIDIALFGRMVAGEKELDVVAAAQVAHALSVGAVETEYDFWTALDQVVQDSDDKTGANHLNHFGFNSSTLYRYANLDVDRLATNLGDLEATRRAVAAFTQTIIRSMPSGKQNSFANRTLPRAVVVLVRDTQPINLIGAYRTPIPDADDHVQRACEALRDEAIGIATAYGEEPIAGWVTRVGADTASLDDLGDNVSVSELATAVTELAATRLGDTR